MRSDSNPSTTETVAVAYCRVSTAGQQLDGTSLGTQAEAIERYCAERGYRLVETFSDAHSGGELWERPALSALREAVRSGGVDVVVCYALDRLSRDQIHTSVLYYEIQKAGARVELVTQSIDDDGPIGTMLRNNLAFAAEFERVQFIERSIRGRRARVRGGAPLPGPRPKYGYRWADDRRTRLVIDPGTAPVVRRIFDEAKRGVSLRKIADGLTRDYVPTPSGKSKRWGLTSVRHILLDESYVGVAKGLRWQSVKENGTSVARPRPAEDVVTLPEGTIPPLVDRRTFDAIADRLERNKREATPFNPDPEASLLRAGFVRCGVCGNAMAVQNKHGRYRCFKHKPTTVISRDALDRAVWERVCWIVLSDEAHAEFAASVEAPDYSADLDAILTTMNGVERARRNTLAMVDAAKDQQAIEEHAARYDELTARLRELEQEYAIIEDVQRDAWELREFLTGFEEWRRRRAEGLANLDYQGRRNLMKDLGIEVVVNPASVNGPRVEIRSRIAPSLVFTSLRSSEHQHPRPPIPWGPWPAVIGDDRKAA